MPERYRFDAYEARTGRKLAGLRGETREKLDRLLLTTLGGSGIGRSAFILAAIDLVENMNEDEMAEFRLAALGHEVYLADVSPYAQGA